MMQEKYTYAYEVRNKHKRIKVRKSQQTLDSGIETPIKYLIWYTDDTVVTDITCSMCDDWFKANSDQCN